MSELKSPKQVLTEAADHVERVGLYKGGFFERNTEVPLEDRPCCALGAIGIYSGYFVSTGVAGGYETVYGRVGVNEEGYPDQAHADAVSTLDGAASNALQDALNHEVDATLTVPAWSDAPATTAADVAALMRKAAGVAA